MALRPTLAPRLTQRQAITQEMQQSVQILAMSGPQLIEFLTAEQEDYPLLDVTFPKPAAATLDFDQLQTRQTLLGSLMEQINLVRLSPEISRIARDIVGHLDPDGMLRSDLGQFADRAGRPLGDVIEALQAVQTLDPAGIATRSTAERWEIQLRARGNWSPTFDAVIQSLRKGQHDPDILARNLDLHRDAVIEVMQELRSLPTDLAAAFESSVADYRLPEVTVIRQPDGILCTELNVDAFPKAILSESAQSDAQSDFSRAGAKRAKWLGQALQKRARAILKVMTALVELQPNYFVQGDAGLIPLTQKDIAKHTAMAESTVTRTVNGKLFLFEGLACPMTDLFSSGVPQQDGSLVSAAAIRARIHALLRNETPKYIYSDNKIKTILEKDGITVARRTIAKYREGMNIPKASIRRIQKRLSQRD